MLDREGLKTPGMRDLQTHDALKFGGSLEAIAHNFPAAALGAGIIAVEGLRRLVFDNRKKGK